MAQTNQARTSGQPQPQPIFAPNWFLGLVPRELWNVYKTFFVYEQDFIPLASQATTVGTIQIQADSHFLCTQVTALVTDITNTTVINSPSNANASGKLVLITDVGSAMPLSQVPIPLESLFGTGQLPGVLSIPKLFRASGSIAIQIQNLIATAHNVRLSFLGIRLYPNIPASGGPGT